MINSSWRKFNKIRVEEEFKFPYVANIPWNTVNLHECGRPDISSSKEDNTIVKETRTNYKIKVKDLTDVKMTQKELYYTSRIE